jgi:hypothetical protein
MSAIATVPGDTRLFQVGRSFVHPAFDLVVIGGLLTVPIALWAALAGQSASAFLGVTFPVVALFCNQAHFAASTVRLYTKPHTYEDLPFLTMGLPLVTLGVVSAFVIFAHQIGNHLHALYLTWSPFHYAAQTFGLATMYSYRSGCRLDRTEWWALRTACMLPFLHSLLSGAPQGAGLGWIIPYRTLVSNPMGFAVLTKAFTVLTWTSLLAPLAVFALVAYRSRGIGSRPTLPLLSVALMLSNASWWVLLGYWDAVIWATVLHGIQYLGLMSIFYSEDALRRVGNQHGRPYHIVVLLGVCIALGYGLFQCWPRAYVMLGFGRVESMYMVIAAINIHHFIVDRYIWRIRKDQNYRTVIA